MTRVEDAPHGARRAAIGLAGLLALSAVVRAFAWSRTAVVFNDGPIFLALARALGDGELMRVLAHPQHPLYPAAIALVAQAGVTLETAAVAVSIAGGVASVAAIFVVARRLLDERLAWMSAWIVALHPWAVDFSSDVMSDGLYAGLYLAAFVGLVALLERPRLFVALGVGLAGGLAYWTRPEGFGLVVAAVVLVAFSWVGKGGERRRWAAAGIALALTFGATAGGLLQAERRATGDFALTQKKALSVLVEGGPSAEALALDRRLRREARLRGDALPVPESSRRATPSSAERPPHTPIGAGMALGRALATSVSAVRHEVVLFALIGILAGGRRPGRAFDRALGVTLVLYTALLALLVFGAGYLARRHALAPLLPLALYAAIGWEAIRGRLAPNATGGASLALFVVVLAVSWGPRDLRARRVDRIAERRAAEWLAAQPGDAGFVAAEKMRTAYYAEAIFVPLPDGRDGLIERQLRGRGTRFVILERAQLADHLGLEAGLGDWLHPIHVERSPDQEVLVLALAPAAP